MMKNPQHETRFRIALAVAVSLCIAPSAMALSFAEGTEFLTPAYLATESGVAQHGGQASFGAERASITPTLTDDLNGQHSFAIEFDSTLEGEWFTGFDFDHVGDDQSDAGWYDAQILKDNAVLWSSYGGSYGGGSLEVNAIENVVTSDERDLYGDIEWYGSRYLPIHGGLRIGTGDVFELRLSKDPSGSQEGAWSIQNLRLRAGGAIGGILGKPKTVPEPGAALLALLGGSLLALRRRR